MVNSELYSAALKSLWDGKCTVTVRQNGTDEKTGRVIQTENEIYTDVPCRLSYQSVNSAGSAESAAEKTQSIKLYVDKSIDIPEGSKITVTQNGTSQVYERSGVPAVYSVHKQIPLELFKEWA